MGIASFKADDVRRVITHASQAKDHEVSTYGVERLEPGTPAVFLVGDRGVYLMSNGLPRDVEKNGDGEMAFVAYATGIDPTEDEDWYDRKVLVFGGDDGGHLLPWCESISKLLEDGRPTIEIDIGDADIGLIRELPAERERRLALGGTR